MAVPTRNTQSVSTVVGKRDNKRRWYALRYLRACTYPATIGEVSDYVGPRVGTDPDVVEVTLRNEDVPALEACEAIEYDPESELLCLDEDRASFADRARRAIGANALTYQKPPRVGRAAQGAD